MARCEYCGNIVPDGQASCPVCGAKMGGNSNGGFTNGGTGNQQYTNQTYNNGNQSYNGNQNYNTNQGYRTSYQNEQNNMQGTDYTYMYDPMDISGNKVMAVLAYLGILVLIPLFANHTSRYARFHTSQGLNLFLANVILGILQGSVSVFSSFALVSACCTLLRLALFIFMILGIVNAVNGRAKELPVIGKIRILNLF